MAAAKSELAAVATGRPDSALIGRAFAASLPFLGMHRTELQAIREEVKGGTREPTSRPRSRGHCAR